MGSTKQINIKHQTYYFYNDFIDIETLDVNLLKIDKKRTKTLIPLILDMPQKKDWWLYKYQKCQSIIFAHW